MPPPAPNLTQTPLIRPKRTGTTSATTNSTADAHIGRPNTPEESAVPPKPGGMAAQFLPLLEYIREITDKERTKTLTSTMKGKLKADAEFYFAKLMEMDQTGQAGGTIAELANLVSNLSETSTAITKSYESYASVLKRVEVTVTKTRDDHVHTLRNTEAILAHAKSTPPTPISPSTTLSSIDHISTSTPWSAKPARKPASELDIVISMTKVDRKAAIRTKTPAEIRAIIEEALTTTTHDDLKTVTIRGTRKLANGNILAQASTGAQAQALKAYAASWTQHLDPNATIVTRRYPVIVNFVPTSFKANEPGAKAAIYNENQGLFPNAQVITSVRWLHQQRPDSAAKNHSSLIIDISDELTADTAISQGIKISESICPTAKYIPPPLQCFHCQSYGHLAKACPVLKDPSQLKCARCAGNHSTKDCACTSATKCTNLRTCQHIVAKCANCEGPHKSFSNECPVKLRATNDIASRYNTSSPYFDPEYSPRAHSARRV